MWEKIKKLISDRDSQKRYAVWIFQQSRPYAGRLTVLMLIKISVVLFGVFSAAVDKLVIDCASAALGLKWSLTLLVALNLLSLVLGIVLDLLTTLWTEKFSYQIRNHLYDQILQTKWSALQQFHSEELLSRMTSDIGAVTNGIVNLSIYLVSLAVQIISAFLLLYHYDKSLAVFALILGPIAAAASILFGVKLKKLQVHLQQSEADYRIFLQEHLSHVTILKAFCQEEQSRAGLDRLQGERFLWVCKKNAMSVAANAVIGLSFFVGYLFAFISGVLKLAKKAIGYGTLSAFLSLVGQIQAPIMGLADTLPQVISVLASAGRIMDIDGLPKETLPAKRESAPLAGRLGVFAKNIFFSYGGRAVFQDASFSIAPGAVTAVVGESGAGKTTLIRLLLAFLEPQKGRIVYQDRAGHSLPCSAAARAYISYVPQGNTLFSGTIRENLQMGSSGAADDDMERALRAADAWPFVSALPNGLETTLGETGAGLSEGQAQRISIARALLRKVPVLLLDEATSALDEKTELCVLQQIAQLPEHPTCIFITHRSSVLAYCTQILRVEEKKITEIQKNKLL
ncbi:MAG: ABC transporter ATP-binding protein [Oscillospiraceae bacterium]|nr:ABC transporter ATP-binding protein [Oscillospiraceae bacterium]